MRLNSPISGGGYPSYQLVFESNPADPSGRGEKDEGIFPGQGTSLWGQFAQLWKLRTMEREAVLGEVANSKLRRLLAKKVLQVYGCGHWNYGAPQQGSEWKEHTTY